MATDQPPSDAPTTDPSGPPTSEDGRATPVPPAEPGGTLLSAPQPATRWEVDFEERLTRSEQALARVEERLDTLRGELSTVRETVVSPVEATHGRRPWFGVAWLVALALGVVLARLLR